MYTKTNWVDNTTPIDKTNLNKIEQGIYDNSLVVDAIKNTINPTDTETYKTAELTEGQITDVIGVSDILIKGQTSQNGEPTPSSPVDVNVVSGSNVIEISNKNLINISNFVTTLNVGITITKIGAKWIINGTATADNIFKFEPISAKNLNGKYALSINYISGGMSGNPNFNVRNKSTDSVIFRTSLTTSNTSNTATLNTAIKFGIFIPMGSTFNNYTFYPMLETGSTATTYEPHQGKELPLDLGTIELCKIGDYQDYFYKSGSKWYLHKETLKIIIPRSVNGTMQNSNKRFSVNKTQIGNYDILNIPSSSQTFGLYCDILKEVTANQTWDGTQGIAYNYNTSSGTVSLNFAINGLTTVAEYQEALAGKIIIARLNTPTNTEITDTILISQLEAIYNAPLYQQTNITQTNNDLPMVLDITACKDNINGIKAFIRK